MYPCMYDKFLVFVLIMILKFLFIKESAYVCIYVYMHKSIM